MKKIVHALSALTLLATAMPALAQQETRQAHVSYSDLNLGSQRGVATLEGRVNSAVRQVCDNGDFSLQEKMQQNACARAARSKASGDVNNAIRSATENRSTVSQFRPSISQSHWGDAIRSNTASGSLVSQSHASDAISRTLETGSFAPQSHSSASIRPTLKPR